MGREPPELLATRRWVEQFVVGLNFCPFAGAVVNSSEFSIQLCDTNQSDELLSFLARRLAVLASQPSPATELIVHPKVLIDFEEYNQFLELVDLLIEDLDLLGIMQVASFHPQYCFADCEVNAPENFTNRSPYPMLHLLREEMVSEAVDSFPNPEQIPEKNIARLKKRSSKELEQELVSIRQIFESES